MCGCAKKKDTYELGSGSSIDIKSVSAFDLRLLSLHTYEK